MSSNALPRGNACHPCRIRKVRCDGQRPVCKACAQTRRRCEYVPVLNTIEKLENRVQELQNQLRDSTLSQANAPVGTHPSFGEITLAVQALRPPPLFAATAFAYIPQALNSWLPSDEMPQQLRLNLLHIFHQNQSQFNLDLFLPRLQERILLPSNDPRGIHPAFSNAICLVACSVFDNQVERYESYFLQQTREACRSALSMMDRIDHYFVAQVLEASYLLRMGRLQEAYVLSSTLLRFALACELHNISSPRDHYDSYGGLLGPPTDIYDVAERINLWWSCYNLTRRLAVVTGLPDGLPDSLDIVTTVFPAQFSQVEQFGFGAWAEGSVEELFQLQPQLSQVWNDSALSLCAKSAVLNARMQSFLVSLPLLNAVNDAQIYSNTSGVAAQLISTAPTAFPPGGQGPGLHERLGPTLIHVHVDLLYTMLGLNQRRAGGNEDIRYASRLRAARGLARIASIDNSARLYSPIPLVAPMQVAIDVLIETIEGCRAGASRVDVREIQQDLRFIAGFLSKLPGYFPQLSAYISSLARFV